jgi:hypothetical protein
MVAINPPCSPGFFFKIKLFDFPDARQFEIGDTNVFDAPTEMNPFMVICKIEIPFFVPRVFIAQSYKRKEPRKVNFITVNCEFHQFLKTTFAVDEHKRDFSN